MMHVDVVRVNYATSSPEELQRIVEACTSPCMLFIGGCNPAILKTIARMLNRTTTRVVRAEPSHIFII